MLRERELNLNFPPDIAVLLTRSCYIRRFFVPCLFIHHVLSYSGWNPSISQWNLGTPRWNPSISQWNPGTPRWNPGIIKWNPKHPYVKTH